MNENSIIFKGVADGILIILNKELSFEDLKIALEKKVTQAKDFFEGASISISFKGRELEENQELELLEIIAKKSGLEISFVNNDAILSSNKKNKTQNNTTEISKNSSKQISPPELTSQKNMTYYHKGSLRSGQRIDFAGSVVVIGDVNPGAQILAEGNIIILGKLKGSAHAGCKGAKDCTISALSLNPTQLIIKDIIAFFPENLEKERGPELAYVKEEQIFVEPLVN